jgi:hypothetical protein
MRSKRVDVLRLAIEMVVATIDVADVLREDIGIDSLER